MVDVCDRGNWLVSWWAGSREREREMGGSGTAFKNTTPVTYFFQLVPLLKFESFQK
jgi:hypothetical protein